MPLETKTAPSGGIDLGGISNLAGLFLGKDSSTNTNQSTSGGSTSTNSGGTTNTGTVTQSEYTSPEAVKAVVDSILQGTQGLAAVSSGQNKSGLYNSSTNRMLVNDLIARASAEGAKLNKSTTQSINTATADNRSTVASNVNTVNTAAQTSQAPQISASKAAGGLGALQLLSMVGGKDKILQQMFGKKSAANTGTANAGANSPNAGGNNVAGSTNDSGGNTNLPSTANIASSTGGVNNPSAYVGGGSDVSSNSQEVSGDISQSIQPTVDTSVNDLTSVFGNDFSSDNVDLSTSTAGAASGAVTDAAQSISGMDFNAFDPNAAVDAVDPNFDFAGFSDQFSDLDLGFASGGMVDKTKAVLRANPQAEAAFNSGGDDKNPKAEDSKQSNQSNEKPAADSRDGPAVKNGNLGARVLNYIKGYASGGSVEFKDKDTYSSRGPLMLAEGGRVTADKDEINPEAVSGRIAGYSRDGGSNYIINAIRERERTLRDYNNNSTGDADSKRREAIMRDRHGVMERALDQPEAGAGRGKGYASGGRVGYARGGMVDLTNLGLRNRNDIPVVSPLSVAGGSDQIISPIADNFTPVTTSGTGEVQPQSTPKIRPGDTGTKSTTDGSLVTTAGNKSPVNMTRAPRIGQDVNDGSRSAGDATSVPSVVGTPAENQAAMLGMATMGLSQLGIPSALSNLGLNALGLNVTSMNPVSQLVSFLVSQVTGMSDSPPSGLPGTMSAPDADGVSQAAVSDNTGLTADSSVDGFNPDNNQDTSGMGITSSTDGASAGPGNDGGNAGVGGGGGAASSSAGDASGPSYSSGGDVTGPGTPTSDSIPAYLSKDEFVLNAQAVKAIEGALGDGWLDDINDAFKPSNQELQNGKQIHQKQFGKRVA